jgi:hypothetical protein
MIQVFINPQGQAQVYAGFSVREVDVDAIGEAVAEQVRKIQKIYKHFEELEEQDGAQRDLLERCFKRQEATS